MGTIFASICNVCMDYALDANCPFWRDRREKGLVEVAKKFISSGMDKNSM
jgi:hypothetical protein